ncbi:MAG TPA: anthranilate phosphoribosyltransferase [Candidatus Limnocylindrales bacterium]|nr:anthranilate phosphoribosyltransferase [Candidatus Limnocylindrales bacterium]
MIHEALEKLLNGEDLPRDHVERLMEEILCGRVTEAQAASFITAMSMKGQTKDEEAGIDAARTRFPPEATGIVDPTACETFAHPRSIHAALVTIDAGEDLSRSEAEAVMEEILSGGASDVSIAQLLTALRFKGESAAEVAGFASAIRRHAPRIFPPGHPVAEEALVDTCGTGGDARGTFNISTVTAFVVAGAGVRVAKHGNRSASSRCGSADVLEQLGMRVDLSPERVAEAIEEVGIGFLFAPAMHSATRNVAKVRRELKFRTVFNLLGPLTNPANASAQVVGVYEGGVTNLVAQALGELGVRRAFVVHGGDGLDEISISRETFVSELRNCAVRNHVVSPEDFGLRRAPLEAIRGGDAAQNSEIIHKILGRSLLFREHTPYRDIVLANASAAFVAAGKARDFRDGVDLAVDSIDSGAAREKLDHLIAFSQLSS